MDIIRHETYAGRQERLKSEFHSARAEAVRAASDEGQFIEEMAKRGYNVSVEDGGFHTKSFWCEMQEDPTKSFVLNHSEIMRQISRSGERQEREPGMKGPKL